MKLTARRLLLAAACLACTLSVIKSFIHVEEEICPKTNAPLHV